MHTRVIFNHELLPAKDAILPAITPAALYGQGVFTTLAIYNKRPFLWQKHWTRLAKHATYVGIDYSEFDEDSFLSLLQSLIEANGVRTGRARVTLFAVGQNKGFWKLNDNDAKPCNLLMMTGDARGRFNEETEITLSSHRVFSQSSLAGVKSANYLEPLFAFEEAREKGFDEALRVNELDHVVSACMANIFWTKDGELFTPDLETGALEGTTRGLIIKLAKEFSMPVYFVHKDIRAVENADEIFLTSSGIGVCLVKRFDEKLFNYTKESLAWRLREAYKEVTMRF
jgi:branched-subunit amino acid aminotransferase/4-amino-4-deoxychorismate lyase